jgi:hypothetical protein
MPLRKRTIPFTLSSSPAPVALLDDKRWREIEREYGHALHQYARHAVAERTRRFLHFAPPERTAEPLDNSRASIDEIGALTLKLRDMLTGTGQTGATAHAHAAVDRHLRKLGVDGGLAGVGAMVALTHVACERAEQELSSPDFASYVVGNAWGWWVLRLQAILHRNGLPTGVRKDVDKSSDASPFVRFVRALELSFDRDFRRGATSDAACAQLIAKARRDFLASKRRRDKSRKPDR